MTSDRSGFLVSFIIPALNEADHLGETLRSIGVAAQEARIPYEVIVIDHGSADSTAAIAQAAGAKTLLHPAGTIGEIRNLGAAESTGSVLIFLDADVTLTPLWSREIVRVLPALRAGEPLITGSQCSPPESRNLLLQHWFKGLAQDPRNTHVGTGHLIVSAAGFRSIGEFDPTLVTGEDYELCVRAKRLGFRIVNDPKLKVIHHGFPTGLAGFLRREIWHAEGDTRSLADVMRSKIALGSIAFVALHATLLGSLLAGWRAGALASLFLLVTLLFLSSYLKNRHMGPVTIVVNAMIFYPYYAGRSYALVRRLPALSVGRAQRPMRSPQGGI